VKHLKVFFEKQKLVTVTKNWIVLYSHYKTHDAKNGRRIDDFVHSLNKHPHYLYVRILNNHRCREKKIHGTTQNKLGNIW